VLLTVEEYKKVTAYIKELQKSSPLWHAVLYNCNAFVGDIARFMGLETPLSTLSMPADYIDHLRELNISRTDLAKVIGTPVRVEDPAKLRAEALEEIARRENRSHETARSSATPGARGEQSKRSVPASRTSESVHAAATPPR
jgi:hypothetical protein